MSRREAQEPFQAAFLFRRAVAPGGTAR